MTLPNDRRARVLYALLVVAIAYVWQYVLFKANALPWALFIATPLVPLIDRWRPAARFDWHARSGA